MSHREADGVFGGSASDAGIVVAGTHAGEASVLVVQSTGEAKGLEAGRGVGDSLTA